MNREQLFTYFHKYDEEDGVEYWTRNDDNFLLLASDDFGMVVLQLLDVYPANDDEGPAGVLVFGQDPEYDPIINQKDEPDFEYDIEVFVSLDKAVAGAQDAIDYMSHLITSKEGMYR